MLHKYIIRLSATQDSLHFCAYRTLGSNKTMTRSCKWYDNSDSMDLPVKYKHQKPGFPISKSLRSRFPGVVDSERRLDNASFAHMCQSRRLLLHVYVRACNGEREDIGLSSNRPLYLHSSTSKFSTFFLPLQRESISRRWNCELLGDSPTS